MAEPKVHFKYIDGMRALAALYVALGHCAVNIQFNVQHETLRLSGLLAKIQFFLFFVIFRFGHYAVDVFITLSGFCLMLPVARAGADKLQKGVTDYIKRRSRRILPPYYAALFLSLFVGLLIPALRHSTGYWQGTLPAFTFGAIVSHLFLVHNLTPYLWKINTPLWSIAVEWQIYFLFPAMLWLRRKRGMTVTLFIAFMVGLAPHYLLGAQTDQTYPWYIGLFALGMAAADLCFTKTSPALVAFREKTRWLPISGGLFVLIAFLSTLENPRFKTQPLFATLYKYVAAHEWKLDTLVGLMAVCLLIYCTEQMHKGSDNSGVLRFLSHPFLVGIGTYSYSLYLVHAIVIALVDVAIKAVPLPGALFMGTMYFLIVPLALPVAYAFHRIFERPFMSIPAPRAVSQAT